MAPSGLDQTGQDSTFESSSASALSTSESSRGLPTKSQSVPRKSSIRFSHNTSESRSTMSNRRAAGSSESTPIRQADGNAGRSYNTSEENALSSTAVTTVPTAKATPSNSAAGDGDTEEKQTWYKRMAEKYGSVTLDNKGSVARDHLALERTFLAWLRTSLAFASIGIAITQLFRLNTSLASRPNSLSINDALTTLPFAPMLGQSIPPELLPFLQQMALSAAAPTLGPTLLDQLLLLPAPNNAALSQVSNAHVTALDDAQAARLRHIGKPLGATFIAISIVVLFVGFHRYFESQYWIIRGKFPASRGSIALVGLITGALSIACLIVVAVIVPTSFQKK